MKNLLSCLMLMISGLLSAQEICNNGIDDDGDALIDLQDPDCLCDDLFIVNLTEDFEDYTECPTTLSGYLDLITPWRPAWTPQGVNTCGFMGGVTFPEVPLPIPSGEGAMGIDPREGVIRCLECRLVEGESYTWSFYAAAFPAAPDNAVGFTLYGRASCNGLPEGPADFDYDELDVCPTQTGWTPLVASTPVENLGSWEFFSETFVADDDYGALLFHYTCGSLAYSYIDLIEIEGPFEGDGCPFVPQIPEMNVELSGDCIEGYQLSIISSDTLQYQWYLDGVALPGATDAVFNIDPVASPGEYRVYATTNSGRCTVSEAFAFSPDLEVLDVQAAVTDPDCLDVDNGSIELTINSPNAPYDIQWDFGAATAEVNDLGPGTYSVTVTDANACSGVQAFTLNEYLPRTVDFVTGPTDCERNEFRIALSEPPATDLVYLLNDEPVIFAADGTAGGISPGNYAFSYRENSGCEVLISSVILTEEPPYQLFIDESERVLEYGDELILALDVFPPEQLLLDNEITWTTPDGFECIPLDPAPCTEIALNATESGVVRLLFRDELGCERSFAIPLAVSIPDYVYVPNVFSPNRDGVNDLFEFFVTDFVLNASRVEVYDRWGNLLYRQVDVVPGGGVYWDGTFRGKPVSNGVYVYQITLELANGEQEVLSGDVLLTR